MPNTVASRRVTVFGRSRRRLLRVHLGPPVERDGLQRRLLRAHQVTRARPVAAVGGRIDDELRAVAHPIERDHRLVVDGACGPGIAVADGRAHQRGQGHEGVRGGHQRLDRRRVPHITQHELEAGMRAEVQERALPEHEVVERGDGVARLQKPAAKDGSDIAGGPRDENAHRAGRMRWRCGRVKQPATAPRSDRSRQTRVPAHVPGTRARRIP